MNNPLSSRLQRSIRSDIQGMHAYAVQPSAGFIKLDTMENPHRLPVHLQQALGARLAGIALNRYPAERTEDLRAALAQHAGLPAGCALTLGNGSDEIITLLSLAGDKPGACFMAPLPGFVMYEMAAKLQGLPFVGVPLTPTFELDEAAMLAAIEKYQPTLIYLAYPNNPTANLWDEGAIERDSMALMARHPHVLVMRTMSKFGLAGVRIGYLMGRSEIVNEIEKLRPPFNVSVLNAEAALFALEHGDEYQRQAQAIREQRERLMQALLGMAGVTPFPSQANMILTRVPDAARAFAGLKERRILVKNISGLHPLLAHCLRLTVGTPEETGLLIQALRESL
jgi:histidinol-phosphate aminotransferase